MPLLGAGLRLVLHEFRGWVLHFPGESPSSRLRIASGWYLAHPRDEIVALWDASPWTPKAVVTQGPLSGRQTALVPETRRRLHTSKRKSLLGLTPCAAIRLSLARNPTPCLTGQVKASRHCLANTRQLAQFLCPTHPVRGCPAFLAL